ncbi:unnamed protein product [Prunus armeniaca]
MSFLAGAGGRGPTRSIAHYMNGHGLFCGCGPQAFKGNLCRHSSMSNASYSALLFEAGKPSVMACSNKVSSG